MSFVVSSRILVQHRSNAFASLACRDEARAVFRKFLEECPMIDGESEWGSVLGFLDGSKDERAKCLKEWEGEEREISREEVRSSVTRGCVFCCTVPSSNLTPPPSSRATSPPCAPSQSLPPSNYAPRPAPLSTTSSSGYSRRPPSG